VAAGTAEMIKNHPNVREALSEVDEVHDLGVVHPRLEGQIGALKGGKPGAKGGVGKHVRPLAIERTSG
jgi:hypothetical protein